MKEHYRTVLVTPEWDKLPEIQLSKFKQEATDQLTALEENGSTARIEWYFDDPDCADVVRQYFAEKGINITVFYTP